MTGRVVLVREARGVQYAALFLWSILYRVLLFALTIGPIGVPVSAFAGLWTLWPKVEGVQVIQIVGGDEHKEIARGLSLLIGVGLFSWIITKLSQYAWDKLVEIYNAAKKVWVEGWTSNWKSLEGLEDGWRNYVEKKMYREAWIAFKKAHLLTISLMLCVFLVALYAIFGPRQTDASTDGTVQTVYRYVSVVDGGYDIELYMKGGAVFSLAHVKDAQPQNGEGICLDEPQRHWLDEFRKAIGNCIRERPSDKDSEPPVFQVTGYASIAPMHMGGNTSESARLNCKVANWRAAAVGAYLANPKEKGPSTRWRCEDVENTFNQDAPNDQSQCGELYGGPKNDEDNPFLVKVHQWPTPEKMVRAKPADDGAVPDERRFDVEIMNRVVHIKVPEDFCSDAS